MDIVRLHISLYQYSSSSPFTNLYVGKWDSQGYTDTSQPGWNVPSPLHESRGMCEPFLQLYSRLHLRSKNTKIFIRGWLMQRLNRSILCWHFWNSTSFRIMWIWALITKAATYERTNVLLVECRVLIKLRRRILSDASWKIDLSTQKLHQHLLPWR